MTRSDRITLGSDPLPYQTTGREPEVDQAVTVWEAEQPRSLSAEQIEAKWREWIGTHETLHALVERRKKPR